jgi:hypothetical protein
MFKATQKVKEEEESTISNGYVQIVGYTLEKNYQGFESIGVQMIFRKRATGKTYPDKPRDFHREKVLGRHHGERGDPSEIFYFDSDYRFKVSVDFYGDDEKLIRTDSRYYDEFRPLQAVGEVAEIVPGERKTIWFDVPGSAISLNAWVAKNRKRPDQ